MLLDTHVWVWTIDGSSRLGPKTRRRLAEASESSRLCISSISILEIAALHTAGRLQFDRRLDRWIRESIEHGGLRVIDVDADIALDAGMIPASALGDPLDRCLVATAREQDLPLVTADRRLLDYGKTTDLVRTIDATR